MSTITLDITEHHEDGTKSGRWGAGNFYGYLFLESGDSYFECDCCGYSARIETLKEAVAWIQGHVPGGSTAEVQVYDEIKMKPIRQLGRKI